MTISVGARVRATLDAAPELAATLREVCEWDEVTGELPADLRERIASVLADALGIWRTE